MPTVPGGQRRLLFTGNVRTNLVNKYTPGSGVGALSTSTRRALKRRANAGRGTLDSNGNLVPAIPKPCCSAELSTSQKLPVPIIPVEPIFPFLSGNVVDGYQTGTLSLTTKSGTILKSDIVIDDAGGFIVDFTEYANVYDVLILKTNDDCKDILTDENLEDSLSTIFSTRTNNEDLHCINVLTTMLKSAVIEDTSSDNKVSLISQHKTEIATGLGITSEDIAKDYILHEDSKLSQIHQ